MFSCKGAFSRTDCKIMPVQGETSMHRILILGLTLSVAFGGSAFGQAPELRAFPVDQFDKLLTLIKPQPGELRFHEIPWLIDVWEARRKAAAEGKPILVWSGAGGSPLGVC